VDVFRPIYNFLFVFVHKGFALLFTIGFPPRVSQAIIVPAVIICPDSDMHNILIALFPHAQDVEFAQRFKAQAVRHELCAWNGVCGDKCFAIVMR
jgi:hypothetical protein